MHKTLSTFTLALALFCTQAVFAQVSASQPQVDWVGVFLAANESDDMPASTSASGNDETSELSGEERQQEGTIREKATDQDNDVASPPGSGQHDSEASES